jgi:CheY-like chemotaxis protein
MAEDPIVLVVEDDTDTRELIAEVLREDGYCVVGAANGRVALDVLEREPSPPSMILLDLMMPVMSGWEFLDARAASKRLAQVPVLVLSADPARELAAKHRVVAIIGKPFDLIHLLRHVRAVTKSQAAPPGNG